MTRTELPMARVVGIHRSDGADSRLPRRFVPPTFGSMAGVLSGVVVQWVAVSTCGI
jgi:hypothetical protein